MSNRLRRTHSWVVSAGVVSPSSGSGVRIGRRSSGLIRSMRCWARGRAPRPYPPSKGGSRVFSLLWLSGTAASDLYPVRQHSITVGIGADFGVAKGGFQL
jgi:hypothetical protein